MLRMEQIVKCYGRKIALNRVSLELQPGQCMTLIGPNGAGKTTLIMLVSGLIRPDSGQILINGIPIRKAPLSKIIGLVQQNKELPEGLKLREYLHHQAHLRNADPSIVGRLMLVAGLADLQEQYVNRLSGGNQRKLHILSSMFHLPQLLIMDEPTVGLDPIARKNIWKYIRDAQSLGMSILMSTHYLEEAEAIGDQIVFLNEGRVIISGTQSELSIHFRTRRGLDIQLIDDDQETYQRLSSELLRMDFVKAVEFADGCARVYLRGGDHELLPVLAGQLSELGFRISMIRCYKPSLSDIMSCVATKDESRTQEWAR